jgi:RNA polymerase sigma factor (TIGR02999 family)
VTRLLSRWREGDPSALSELVPLVEAELRRLARGYMRNERSGHTLQPTALINEAWMRLAQNGENQPDFKGRAHFIAIAAHYMRQILVEHARRKSAEKRGGPDAKAVELTEVVLSAEAPTSDLVRLDDGLTDLARLDARQAQVVELHYFGGLTYEEIAEFLNIGRSTVIRDLRMAQSWLKNYVGQ